MKLPLLTLFPVLLTPLKAADSVPAATPGPAAAWERLASEFRELPLDSRRSMGPLFWLHGDETPEQLEKTLGKVAEGGNGCFTCESRPHNDWLGPNWFRDLGICLKAAKQHKLKMWIFDEKWWPSQSVGGKVPPRYAAKKLDGATVEITGPKLFEADGYAGERYIATVAGRATTDGTVDADSLLDLAEFISAGKLAWRVPDGRWKIMKFTHKQAPGLGQGGGVQLSVDGASKDCVDWLLETVYQPHYDHFKADFGKTIVGFFYDEPETRGDWGTELPKVMAELGIDWKKAYVAHKFQLSGEAQIAARYQYLEARAETWGRTMYGGISRWCEEHGVRSIGHFMEHTNLYTLDDFCAGDLMRVQKYSSMGGIDAVFSQFKMGQRVARDAPCWQTPKLSSSISHAYGKHDDHAMVEIFGARGQDLTYPEMKWWADHMQVSGVNFLIPHSFNPRAPYDSDCPPYFDNGGFEPRWPLYRVFSDYTSRLSLVLSGGRHMAPVALLSPGQSVHMGKHTTIEQISESLQDSLYDCDWLPFAVFENDMSLSGKELKLHAESYKVLIVPPVEVIPWGTLSKALAFFQQGGTLLAYGFLPTQSATPGKSAADIAALRGEIWGAAAPGLVACKTNAAGGRSYLLPDKPTPEQLQQVLAGDAGIHPTLEVIKGETDHWLHVLHRVKEGRDVFFITNQNHLGEPRAFRFRVTAKGEPECWDPMRNEITTPRSRRLTPDSVEIDLTLAPLESTLLVFREGSGSRPTRLEPDTLPTSVIPVTRVASPETPVPVPIAGKQPFTASPVKAATPYDGVRELPAALDLANERVYLEVTALAPEAAARVTVNGSDAGGFIGAPLRLDITRFLKPGTNTMRLEPFAPTEVKLAVYPIGK